MHLMRRGLVFALLILAIATIPAVGEENPDTAGVGGVNWFAYPYVFYTPETDFAFGAGGIVYFRTKEDTLLNLSQILLSGYYTVNNQYSVSLQPELYFTRTGYYSSLNLAFSKILDKFYGVGNNTPESDKAPYLAKAFDIEAKFRMPVLLFAEVMLIDLIYDFRSYRVVDKKENPLLINDLVSGSDGGLSSGLGIGYVWDDRDNIYFPHSGMFHQFRAVFNMQAIGSDFDYNDYQLDLRGFYAVAPDNIIAAQVYAQAVRGFPPFYELAALGGSERMRGYFEGRFRDRNYITAQVEYRSIVWWRIGLVGFLGAGQVADRTREMSWNAFKPTYGFGLRFVLDTKEKVDIRVDFGWGRGTSGIYFAINEAF
jgi:hypothetical protein